LTEKQSKNLVNKNIKVKCLNPWTHLIFKEEDQDPEEMVNSTNHPGKKEIKDFVIGIAAPVASTLVENPATNLGIIRQQPVEFPSIPPSFFKRTEPMRLEVFLP